jgi:hypothetical protein
VSAIKVVLDAIVTALNNAPAIAGGRIRTNPEVPMPAEHASDVVVTIDSCEADGITVAGNPLTWTVRYGLQARARGDTALATADTLMSGVFARIQATAAPAGVEGWFIAPVMQTRYGYADTEVVSMFMTLDVRLRTQPGTLTLAT